MFQNERMPIQAIKTPAFKPRSINTEVHMQILSLILLLAAAFGVFILAMKYLLGPAPAGYHAEILKADNIEITGSLPTLFRAINIVFASSFLAISFTIASLSWYAFQSLLQWPLVIAVVVALLAGLPVPKLPQNGTKSMFAHHGAWGILGFIGYTGFILAHI